MLFALDLQGEQVPRDRPDSQLFTQMYADVFGVRDVGFVEHVNRFVIYGQRNTQRWLCHGVSEVVPLVCSNHQTISAVCTRISYEQHALATTKRGHKKCDTISCVVYARPLQSVTEMALEEQARNLIVNDKTIRNVYLLKYATLYDKKFRVDNGQNAT